MRTFIFGLLALLGVSGICKADVVDNLANVSDGIVALAANTIKIDVAASPSVGGSQWMTLTAKLFASGGAVSGKITGFSFNLGGNNYGVTGLSISDGFSGNATVDISGANLWAINGQTSTFDLTAVSATTSGGSTASWVTTTNSSFNVTSPYSFNSQTLAGAQFGVAVPEPGTLALGVIASVTGGGGFWWKRRRKATKSSNAAESPAS